MTEYLIKGETLESMADKIRILNGVEGALTTAQMDSNLGEANTEVGEQADLIAQISSALEGKAVGSGSASYDTCTVQINDYIYKKYIPFSFSSCISFFSSTSSGMISAVRLDDQ
jgi:hypothetical protein